MNTVCTIPCRAFAATVILLATAGSLQAGGLVDTSPERFHDTAFNDDESDLDYSANITNRWWTLSAHSNFLYFAESEGECEWNLMEVLEDGWNGPGSVATTSNFESVYAGTVARIVLDRAWVDEGCEFEDFAELVESGLAPVETTYDWFAQDVDGNIWYLGEDTYSHDSNSGSFIAGCDDAEAGIVMLDDPGKGDFYRQELYAGEAEDWGKVSAFIKAEDLVCLKTKEWTPLSPGHNEHKFYCSDGVAGELAWIDELKGKTVTVVLIATDVDAPAPPAGPPNPIPADCE